MRLGDTIVATIGGDGSPRGIVRVSGPGAIDAVARITGCLAPEPGVQRTRVRMAAGELACLALVYRAPRSFSGEDTAELLLPGNRELLRRVAAQLCEQEDVRQALPGEFTARAFIHGKLTAEQAEGVGALIAARTQAEHLAAERLLSGAAGAEYRAIADELATALALLEAGIDFTDQEDVVAISSTELRSRLMRVLATINGLVGERPREAAIEWPLVVLAGAPNAGKSTLFNALLRRERAVVSDVAGTTRDVIVEVLDLAALGWMPGASFGATKLRLADLAGLDADGARVSDINRDAQRAAHEAIDRADVVLWCDPSGRFERGEMAWVRQGDRPVVRVRTKADLAPDGESVDAVSVCALDGWRLAALVRAIQDAISRSAPADGGMLVPRHRQAMLQARTSLDEALGVLGHDDRNPAAAEVVAMCLRAALDEVGSIAGKISPDDVIGRIFATFCIGK